MVTFISRQDHFKELFPQEKAYRMKQINQALFQPGFQGFLDITTLPKDMKERLKQNVPWISLKTAAVLESSKHDTYKALLEVEGGSKIETVLMKNRRGFFTICVSSQVGCAMRCGFCATGKMGLARNLSSDEIVDQYRFWLYFLSNNPALPQRISNVVFMGMGEPLGNYEQVKNAVNTWLAYTHLGLTRITVSTVGVLLNMERILNDPEWPLVRMAVSLHSADPATRKRIVPTSHDDFLSKLAKWCRKYLAACATRRHHVTFEYVMLQDVNDTDRHARSLGDYVCSIGQVKVNLIPYNFTGMSYNRSTDEQIARFKSLLEQRGVIVTVRKTMGDDIAAACGQLAGSKLEN